MKNFISKIIGKIRAYLRRRVDPEPRLWCGNCKHSNLAFDEEPCCYCDKASEWEASL
jgi:hypothetical protein